MLNGSEETISLNKPNFQNCASPGSLADLLGKVGTSLSHILLSQCSCSSNTLFFQDGLQSILAFLVHLHLISWKIGEGWNFLTCRSLSLRLFIFVSTFCPLISLLLITEVSVLVNWDSIPSLIFWAYVLHIVTRKNKSTENEILKVLYEVLLAARVAYLVWPTSCFPSSGCQAQPKLPQHFAHGCQ